MKKKKTESRKKLTCTGILAKLLASLILGMSILILSCSSVPRLYVWFSASNCQNGMAEVVTGITHFDTRHLNSAQLTQENVSRIELLETFYLNRDRFDLDPNNVYLVPFITHPSIDYVLYLRSWGEYFSTVSVCGDSDFARKVIFVSESAGQITFTPDGEYFAIAENPRFEITLYSASTFRKVSTFSLSEGAESEHGYIRDIAFHPTQPLVAITFSYRIMDANQYASIWNYETNERVSQFEVEATHRNIYFNQNGTAIINYSSTPNTPVYIWGVPSE